MKSQHHFEIQRETALQEATKIRTLIADLDRIVRILNCDIATEEEWARVPNRSEAAYPMLAITLSARRDNLRDTVAVLEHRLRTIDQPPRFAAGSCHTRMP